MADSTNQITESKKQPVLLQVLPALNTGGVERGAIDIAKAAAKAGFLSLIASSGGKLENQIKNIEGIKHITLPLNSKNPIRIFRNIAELQAIIEAYNVDIVHARSRAPAWSAYFAAKKTKRHFITTFHGIYSLNFPFKKLYNSVMTRGEKVIAITKFVANHIKENYRTPEDKIEIIYRGVDMEYFNPSRVDDERVRKLKERWRLTENWPVVFMPGRITRWKGQDFLLRALARLDIGAEYYCVMAGNSHGHGKYLKEIMNLVAVSGLQKNVRIVDAVDDIPAAYKLSDVVVSASLRPEAFGRVVAEAQAMGKPVVATDIGGSKETIIHGETGRLVDNRLTMEMAEGIRRGISLNAEKRAELAEKTRKHIAENFSLDLMCDKTIGLYKRIIDNG